MNILIVIAHADDEILGMGATMMKHIVQKDNVFLHILTDANGGVRGAGGVHGSIVTITGTAMIDQALDDMPLNYFTNNIADRIADLNKQGFPIDIVYTHSEADINKDHRYIGEATRIACRPYSNVTTHKVRELRTFIIQTDFTSGNGFTPNFFNPVTSKHIDMAANAADSYDVDDDFDCIYINRCRITGRLIRKTFADCFDVIMRVAE